jgi:ribosomal protein S18 acetylase RimI-like enzyme
MRQAFSEYAGALPLESGALRESVDDVRTAMQAGGAVLAFLGDAAVASARFLPENEELYVGRVAVLPAWRRRGIASALMRYLEDLGRSQGKRSVRIGVRESLPSNIALYESLGYEEIKREPHGADRSVTMRKGLSAP